ncbi:MAG: hypothetical protein AB7K24_22400 [Gemmataceae bacterium]
MESSPASEHATEAKSVPLRPPLALYAMLLGIAVPLAGGLTYAGYPCPTSDDSFYRSAAAELVQAGRMAIPSTIGLVPRIETVFACYPPIYQFLQAGWYLLFGFSLYSSLAFTFTIHLLNALAVLTVSWQLLRGANDVSPFRRGVLVLGLGLIQVANLAYFDRQEETALLWLWLELLVALHFAPGLGRALSSGLLLGLTALTSPWVGLLGGVMVALRTLAELGVTDASGGSCPRRANGWRRALVHLGVTAILSMALVACWVGTMELHYPGIIDDQFFGLMRHIGRNQGAPELSKNLAQFGNMLLYNKPQLPILFLTLVLFPLALVHAGWRHIEPVAFSLYFAGLFGIVVVAVLRPIAYPYLGTVQILLLPCFAPALVRYLRGEPLAAAFGLGLLALCLVFAWQRPAAYVKAAFTLPEQERPDAVCRRLAEVIAPGERVNITGRFWHCFQGRNPWYEAYFLRNERDEMLRARWFILAQGVGTPAWIDEYELVEEVPASVDADYSYAYSLWRRREH